MRWPGWGPWIGRHMGCGMRLSRRLLRGPSRHLRRRSCLYAACSVGWMDGWRLGFECYRDYGHRWRGVFGWACVRTGTGIGIEIGWMDGQVMITPLSSAHLILGLGGTAFDSLCF